VKIDKIRKHRKEHEDGQFYEPSSDDPPELGWPCRICPADVGEWCGSFGDIHAERKKPTDH
jgi:hypothetical protein